MEKYEFIEYRGALQPSEIYTNLSKYDVMLLPTHFYTEGLPGSVVDAYISGIPVIVTEWKHSHEFVDNGKSGYIVPFDNGLKEMVDGALNADLKEEDAQANIEFAKALDAEDTIRKNLDLFGNGEDKGIS